MTKLHGDKKLRDTQLRNARKEYVSKFNFETIIENTFMRYYKS
ncbi:MAG: hypothetical protein QG549_91 [Patescibacteria group bacterium]|nr:hypothetical protein [Patescibacteria group bacterium]